ncbi:hypothetical protein [Kitasatospora sp. NBC_00315]|uniref:hypothetical protein n=1 Tax=Kitasatospora sp. NBC_00315 TaxID=2975963 RepID=UPI00324EF013
MNPTQHSPRVSPALRPDADPDTLDALVSSSRYLGRFWPPMAVGVEPATPAGSGFAVSSGAQQLVAAMTEYGA